MLHEWILDPDGSFAMSLPKRRIDIDANMPVRELLKLLNAPEDRVTVVVEGEPVLVEVHAVRHDAEQLSRQERLERSRRAMERFRAAVDLDELERYIYEGRDSDPIKPPVNFE